MASELAETWSTTEPTTLNLQGWCLDLRLRGTLDSPSHPPRRHPRGRGASRPWPAIRSLHCAVYTTRVPGIQTWHFEGDGFDRRQWKNHGEIRSDICNWHIFQSYSISIFQYVYHMYISIWIKCNDLTSTSLEWWLGAGNSSNMASIQLCESPESQFIQIWYIKEQPFYR